MKDDHLAECEREASEKPATAGKCNVNSNKHRNMFNMQRQVTKTKLKREKIEMENNEMAASTTTVTPGHICVLCRREMSFHPPFRQNDEMLRATCCCEQAVERSETPASSEETNSTRSCKVNMASSVSSSWGSNDYLNKDFECFVGFSLFQVIRDGPSEIATCSQRRCQASVETGNRSHVGSTKNNRTQREKFNIFSNCHNILRTLQSLLLLMFNCGIFNRRRRRQQQQQQQQQHQQQSNVNYTKFLLLLQTLAAATTRLSLGPNHNNQQQLKHNQQLPRATPQQPTKEQPEPRERFHHYKRHFRHWNNSLIWILALNLMALHATASVVLPQQAQHLQRNSIADSMDSTALEVSAHSRSTRSNSNEKMRLSTAAKPCKSIDIRNTASDFNQLENCTIIEGFLLINLINDAGPLNRSFPDLVEVTDFIVVYRVTGLHSLSQVFPNLNVIRGLSLLDGYALIVFSNADLLDLGLPRLRSITNGAVRIERNHKLCFERTVNWENIIANENQSQIVLTENSNDCQLSKCPGEIRMGSGHDSTAVERDLGPRCPEHKNQRLCWDSKNCQTICPAECKNNCIDEKTCCHKDCLGCVRDKNGKESCISCRNVSLNNVCLDICPVGYFVRDSRCVTERECLALTKFEKGKELNGIPYNGSCLIRCPQGYKYVDGKIPCEPCPDGRCDKECVAGLIDSLQRAREYVGCTIITGEEPLTISVKRESGANVMDDLEKNLGEIHTIRSSLMVHLTYGVKSLKFFKSLTEISGNPPMESKRFALYVLDNRDLEEIWPANQTVFIRNGGVFFHFNPKLCVATINKLLPMLASKPTSFDKRDVATDSNGNRGSCGTEVLTVTTISVGSTAARLNVTSRVELGEPREPTNATVIFKDPRAFIGYVFYHTVYPEGFPPKSEDDPCDKRWEVSAPDKSGELILSDLHPFTRYVYYVRTMAISSELTNAESALQEFKTNPGRPSMVTDFVVTAISDSKINVTWTYTNDPKGVLTRFFIKAKLINRPFRNNNRDYCSEPLEKAMENDMPATTPVKKPDKSLGDCECDGTAKKSGKKEFDDRNTQASMEFENTLQNFVFVPNQGRNRSGSPDKSKDSGGAGLDSNAIPNGGAKNSARQRRHLPEFDSTGGSVLLRHVRSMAADTKTKDSEDTFKDHEILSANKKFYEVFARELPVNQTYFVFDNLRHFTRYSVYVVACRQEIPSERNLNKLAGPPQLCSDYESIFQTTKKRDQADNVTKLQVVLENANNTESSVRLSWDPPVDPNGEIVTYEVAYKLQKPDQVEEKKCIPVADYNQTAGYPLKLNEGLYSFRVRANSIAGYGAWTDFKYREVEPPPSYAKYFIWSSGIAGALLIIFLMAYVRHLRKRGPSNDLHMNTEVNPFYASMQYIPDDWEVLRENIIQLAPLGQGSFGMVYEGILKSFRGNGEDMECAIKTVNENATDRERTNFLSEASVMKEFDTYHVVRLLGVCSRGQPALVVMELMKKGDLKSYLRAHRPEERDEAMMAYLNRIGVTGNAQPPTYARIYQMAIEIADGMAYLAAKKFVHRDLAARNCMVADDLTVKIGDFGMTRDIYETDYYRKGTKGLLPVRWMPPESLRDGVYSSASDVFSFGVVLWEMATLAAQPYQGLSNEQVLRFVMDGGVMERPENCPDLLHRLMQRCWHHRSSARPSFLDIIAYLEPQCPSSKFKDVSFYHSNVGLQHREKERKERNQMDAFAAVPLDQDIQDRDQQEDTTPLRTGDYQGYKSNMEQNSSLDQPAESPIALVDDQVTHSPFSLPSGFIASSTPDGQAAMPTAFQNLPPMQGSDFTAYVQPDADALAGDQGYELYDPSPKCAELPTSRSGSTGGGGKLSGEQHLLPKKGRQPVIMSSSMPDDVIGGSSLQPSTASAASSNASSHTGRLPSLKRAVADTFRNRANLFNRHVLNHKRTGSNASHKSNASNAPSTSSNTNLTSHPVAMGNLGTIESGGSGSAGSYTGTPRFYTPTATPSAGGGGGMAISDNPNYKLLDESLASEQATILTTSSPNPNYEMMHPPSSLISTNPNYVPMNEPPVQMAGVTISHNPNYQPMQAPLNARQSSSDEDNELDEEDDDDEDDDVDDEHVEHIKMERMPLSRPRQRAVPSKTQPPRSRSVSQTRKSPTNSNSGVATTGAGNMSNLLKESWLRPASTTRPPPPNGFIGREA
ncbi:insulin-like receptor [Drosophila biarmipes]|uniref:insulin-like receptor n=1 Tax=Drosophila biarmipes TaxID=125945 RepID=UPI0007E8716D|nr:insulin-like receptor [Drosophila biarmipes]